MLNQLWSSRSCCSICTSSHFRFGGRRISRMAVTCSRSRHARSRRCLGLVRRNICLSRLTIICLLDRQIVSLRRLSRMNKVNKVLVLKSRVRRICLLLRRVYRIIRCHWYRPGRRMMDIFTSMYILLGLIHLLMLIILNWHCISNILDLLLLYLSPIIRITLLHIN